MTVYYYDLFTGTAGTLLTSHTADSGATWPNDADHYYGTGIVALDGLGGVYQSNTGSSINLSSAAMPSTQNFEVLFSYIRKTSIAANAGLIFLSSSWPTIADCYELFYAEGDGWLLYHTSISGSTNTLLAGPYAGPAFGVTWYMKVDVSTSGGNTNFTVYYSIASTGPFTQLFSYTAATSTDLVAVGTRFYNPSTASTVTTGQHIGALTVQDIPALSSATLSGPTQQLFSNPAEFTVGLNEPPGTGGVVVTPASSNGSDTFQATHGGANVTSSTLAAGQPSGTYWLTPGVATGNRTIPITTSPTLTCPNSPFTYDALPAATGYTVTGATGGHQLVPVTWTITLIGGDFAGTITATPGGGTGQSQIFSPIVITFTGNGTLSKTFSFTPLDVDSVTFTFTNSGTLTNPSPKSYISTGEYLVDTFSGTSGTAIQSHTSNTLPSGVAGSPYTVSGSGAIDLDGNGMVFLSGAGDTYALSQAAMTAWSNNLTFEVLFDIENVSNISGSSGGIALVTYPGNVYHVSFSPDGNIIQFYLNGSTFGIYTTTVPAPGVLWHMKFDWIGNGIYPGTYLWYSTDNVTWNTLWSNVGPGLASGISPVVAVGPYMQGTAVTATTGVHVGNLVVQDIAPPTPNCQISKAYVASSGQSVAFFFETISGGASVIPTAMNYAPSFFRNGVSIGVGVNAFVTGTTSCAILQFANSLQVNPGDVMTVTTPASWMTCGVGNAADHVANQGIINNTGVSCFGTDALTKTFKPGLNISYGGICNSASFNIFANLRYRLQAPPFNWGASVDGYLTSMEYPSTTLNFYDFNPGNSIDSTEYPGVPGYYAVGYDDNAYATAPTTLTLVSSNSAYSTVTQIHSCDNTGTNGIGQFYLFEVTQTPGSPVANLPISLQWYNARQSPQVSNLFILGPGDFTVPSLGETSWSFSRSNPYALSNQFLINLANGVGCLRWLDSVLGLGSAGVCNMCEPWEMHQLADFSWDNSLYVNSTITLTTARPLTTANSPYLYSDFFGSPWTAGSGLGQGISGAVVGSGTVSVVHGSTAITFSTSQSGLAGLSLVVAGDQTGLQYQIASGSGTIWTLTTTWWGANNAAASWSTLQTTITIASAATDPLFYGLLLLIDSEKMRVRGVSGTSVWVERGASGTIPAAHASGATITIYSRYAWTELTAFGSGATQVLEFVTSTPHGFKAGQYFQPGGSLPTMTCTDGSTVIIYNEAVWPTGPSSFVQVEPVTTSGAVTLSTSYTPSGCTITNQNPAAGFPHDAIAIATATIPGANIHVPLPMLASDSYCYNVANKILSNFPTGRKVYVELADEPWNYAESILYQSSFLGRFNGYSSTYSWYVIRAGQIRAIFRNVFGSRADEIYMMLNNQFSAPNNGAEMFGGISAPGIATSNNLIFDAYAVATYIQPNNASAHVAAWNASSIPQMADLFIHDVYYTPGNTTEWFSSAATNIADYNAWLDANIPGTRHCFLYGYEGGYAYGAPNGCTTSSSGVNLGMGGNGYGNICPALDHDIAYDPVWRIYEKDFYALLQHYGLADNCLYSYSLYYFYQNNWGLYHWVGQQPGKGDGSDGKANNRLCLATPGYTYSKASTTNQDQQNVSVRGQALLEWMQPAQTKKRMLFVPSRFVNR